ncbi:hypothetical protein FHP26_24775 [Pseudomonas orientalis]|nr:hypothetical protein [Pseudomonas orientalis]
MSGDGHEQKRLGQRMPGILGGITDQGTELFDQWSVPAAKADPNVGGGLPPMAVCQLQMYWLIHCYRGQAPSHIWNCVDLVIQVRPGDWAAHCVSASPAHAP